MKKTPTPIIIKREKPAKFDLSFKKSEQNIKIISAIESLKVNAGWQFLTQIFQKNIDFLANQILTKRDEIGVALTDSEVDIIRSKYEYLKEVLNTPEKYLKELTRTDSSNPDLDPYDK